MGTDCGSGGQAGWREAKGRNWGNCNSINNKIFKLKKYALGKNAISAAC